MEQDLARLRTIRTGQEFIALFDRIINDTLTEDYWTITVPNEMATTSAYSPVLFAYYAALNLLNARVLFSDMRVAEMLDPTYNASRSALERHHLFPKAYLNRVGISDRSQVNQIANYALVEWSDNGMISDKAPSDYYPLEALRYPDGELSLMEHHHGLPPSWHSMAYDDFLEERRHRLAQVTREGFMCLQERATAPDTATSLLTKRT